MADVEDSILTPESVLMFKKLEAEMELKIPVPLKNLLELCGYNNLYALANFNEEDINVLENKASDSDYNINTPTANIFGNHLEEVPGLTLYRLYRIKAGYQKALIAVGKYAADKVKLITKNKD